MPVRRRGAGLYWGPSGMLGLFTLLLTVYRPGKAVRGTPVSRPSTGAVTVIPFTLSNGYIFVEAAVDGHHGTFLLDTGSPLVVLNANYMHVAIPELGIAAIPRRQLDTLTSATPRSPDLLFVVHTVQLGSLTLRLDPRDLGPPTPWPANGMIGSLYLLDLFDHPPYNPLLGLIGLPVLESFETVIDYQRQQLILIKLDAAGRPLAPVPRAVLVQRMPLLPVRAKGGIDPTDTAAHWWGVVARLNGYEDTLLVDTGTPYNSMLSATLKQLGQQWQDRTRTEILLDTLVIVKRKFARVSFHVMDKESGDILGYPMLRELGLVGFNFRARQLILYRPTRQ